MKRLRNFFLVIVVSSALSCAGGTVSKKTVPEKLDRSTFKYPRFQISEVVQRISIIGTGGGSQSAESYLTQFFMSFPNVRVIEPGSLNAVLGGKVIQYGTGLSSSESLALSQLMQIDHILLYEEKISPHRDYQFGGRESVRVNLKIINTISGDLLYQTGNESGLIVDDPRPYGYGQNMEMISSLENFLRDDCMYSILFELSYAFGNAPLGFRYNNDLIIEYLLAGSPAHRAGLKQGDRLVEVDGIRILHPSDFPKKLKQGNVITVRVDRAGTILRFECQTPVIPVREERIKKGPGDKTKDGQISL